MNSRKKILNKYRDKETFLSLFETLLETSLSKFLGIKSDEDFDSD